MGSFQGIWNHRNLNPRHVLEMEISVRGNHEYLMYEIPCDVGKYFNTALSFAPKGTIHKLSCELRPNGLLKETAVKVGDFSLKPRVAKPMVDRGLKC